MFSDDYDYDRRGPVASVSLCACPRAACPSFHQSDLYLLSLRDGLFVVCALFPRSTFHVFRAARNMQLGSKCTRQRG